MYWSVNAAQSGPFLDFGLDGFGPNGSADGFFRVELVTVQLRGVNKMG
jgi:hypothetical protein